MLIKWKGFKKLNGTKILGWPFEASEGWHHGDEKTGDHISLITHQQPLTRTKLHQVFSPLCHLDVGSPWWTWDDTPILFRLKSHENRFRLPIFGEQFTSLPLGKLSPPQGFGVILHAWGSRCVSFRGSFSAERPLRKSSLKRLRCFHQIFWDFKVKNGKSVPNIHSSHETFFIPFSVFWMVCSPANPSKSREQAWLPLGNLKRTQTPSPAVVVGEWLHAQTHIVLCPIHGLCTMSVFRREIVNDGCCTPSYAGQHPVNHSVGVPWNIQRKPCPHIISDWLYSISEGSSVIRSLIYACHG